MGNILSVAEMGDKLFKSSLHQLNLAPPEFISGPDDIYSEDRGTPLFSLLEKGESELIQSNKKEDIIEPEKEDPSLRPVQKKEELNPKEPQKGDPSNKQDPSFMDSFLVELIHNIKNGLASIYHATVLSMDQYDDSEIRKWSQVQVKEDIKKIDSVLNSVLNFININTPIIKANTLYVILEEILEANEKLLRQKDIKIRQKYEKDLPDTFIHTEQVRFILHSVLQYAILSTPPNKSIGFLIKSSDSPNRSDSEKILPGNNRRYIEVMVGFYGDKNPMAPVENRPEIPVDQKEGMADLILKLAKEILQRNHGMMVETRGKNSEMLITLRFPVERRKVVYYEPIAI